MRLKTGVQSTLNSTKKDGQCLACIVAQLIWACIHEALGCTEGRGDALGVVSLAQGRCNVAQLQRLPILAEICMQAL